MYEVTVTHDICAAHFLTNVPCGHKCSRLHGHNYKFEVEVSSPYETNGFVIDFSILKKALKDITEPWDHRVLLPYTPEEWYKMFAPGNIYLDLLGVSMLESGVPLGFVTTAENLAKFVATSLVQQLPSTFGIRVTVWETPTCSATYIVN